MFEIYYLQIDKVNEHLWDQKMIIQALYYFTVRM